jgi:uncharacterized membrane protein YciS (DUF1049 family)
MEWAALVFLTLGILIIGFGLLSLCNILNLPMTDHQAENANLIDNKFRVAQAKIMALGAVLFAIGLAIALLIGA